MKILHILNELKFSGAEIMYADAADEFKSLGCELYVANTTKRLGEYAGMFRKAGYKVYHFPYPDGLFARWDYYRRMIRWVKDEGIEVIHTHRSDMKWGMALVARMAGIRSVYTFHSCFKSRPVSYPYHMWLRWSAKHLLGCRFQTISDSVYDNERQYYHNDTVKVYNWFGNKRFFPADESERLAVRRELDISPDTFVMVSVGGCSHIKRHHDIIKALSFSMKENGNILYLHLGQGNTTEEERALAKELGVEGNIRFMGNQNDVRKYLIVSDVYLMTSRYEGISITTIEALACKIPAILYDVAGLRDFNKEQPCSILIPEQPIEIVKAVKRLKANDEEREGIVKNGYELVRRKFFLTTNVRKIVELYR